MFQSTDADKVDLEDPDNFLPEGASITSPEGVSLEDQELQVLGEQGLQILREHDLLQLEDQIPDILNRMDNYG